MALRLSRTSTEFVLVPTEAKVAGEKIDPTAATVSMAFLPQGDSVPEPTDWMPANWETNPVDDEYLVRCLVGPDGGVILTPGTFQVWVRIETTDEDVRRPSGTLVIF